MEPLHTVEVELNNYMMSPTIDSEMDPLTWWQVHQVDFPHLSKLARKYLCIPASSSPSERLFSTSGNVVTCQRTCLKPTKVNMLIFQAKKTGIKLLSQLSTFDIALCYNITGLHVIT